MIYWTVEETWWLLLTQVEFAAEFFLDSDNIAFIVL